MTTQPNSAPPYARLDPDCILSAVESLGLMPSGSLLALNSYENRVYQIGIDDAPPLIAKFYRPERWSDAAIAEEHAFLDELAAAELPVIPPLRFHGDSLLHYAGYRFALFPRRGGRAPELDQPGAREWLGRLLGRIHAIGRLRPFVERTTLTLAAYGENSLAYLAEHDFIPPDLAPAWNSVTADVLIAVRAAFDRAGALPLIRLHGDCHPGNLLWTDAGPHFVDFDDSLNGPAVQDLWMLLSGERNEQSRQLADLLAGYEDFCDFDPRQLHLVEALRSLRLLHHAAWLARRWRDPAFPAAFPWFNRQQYWQEQILALREQLATMAEGPLWPV